MKGASAHPLNAGELEAVFLPGRGMLCASLRHRGTEILRRVDDLDGAAAKGRTAGIPLLHPWANRLASLRYHAAGRDVTLDPESPFLHFDDNRLPIHGVPWPLLSWDLTEAKRDRLAARLEWVRSDLLAIFPFPHRIELLATLHPDGLTLETTLIADREGVVPVSFGFHPYLGLPGSPRAEWRLTLPAMQRLLLDPHGIPTGDDEPFGGLDAYLGERDLDDGFELHEGRTSFSITGAGLGIFVELLTGYRYAQVFAPKGKDFVALEPMTAPASALTSGHGLRFVEPGGAFHAVFRVRVLRRS